MTVKTMGRIVLATRPQLRRQIHEWIHRYRTRRHLLGLDDRLLADIGVTREVVAREAAKPFWEA